MAARSRQFLLLFLALLFSFWAAIPAMATITITNGFWITTFDCGGDYDPCVQGTNPACIGGGFIYGNGCNIPTGCSNNTDVLTSANYPSGNGGQGLRIPYGTSGGTMGHHWNASLSTSSNEIWVRWYARIPSNHNGNTQKAIYLYDSAGGQLAIKFKPPGDMIEAWYVNKGWGDTQSPVGMSNVYGSLSFDNQWHCYEVYANISAGTLRVWMDNYLKAEWRGQSFGGGVWTSFTLPSNMSGVSPSGTCYNIDYDDYAVAIGSYTGFVDDGNGNKRIGLVGGGGGGGGSGAPIPPRLRIK